MNQALITAATLGTAQNEFVAEGHPLLAQLDPHDRERQVLVAAALLTLQAQAGQKIAQDQRPLPEPSELDEAPIIHAQAIRHLMIMLEGHYGKALPEWLAEVARRGRRVPEESLPLLLETGRKRPEYRPLIMPIIGQRGLWLAQQAKDKQWKWFSVSEKDWEEGALEIRREFLENLRATDSTVARELLMSVWASEKAPAREKLLACLTINLSMEDEPFLETVLDDKAQGVRAVAQNLLAHLPESRLVQRMIERAAPLLHFHKNKLTYDLPSAIDAAGERDGLKPVKEPDETDRQGWFWQMLAQIPPHFWCEQWGISPVKLVEAALKSETPALYLEAWLQVAPRLSDIEFIEALLPALFSVMTNTLSYEIYTPLAAQLPADRLEKLAVAGLKEANSPLVPFPRVLLMTAEYPWSSTLTRTLLDNLRRYLSKGNTRPDYLLRVDLLRYALYFPPDLREEVIKTLDVPTSAEKAWGDMVDEIRLLLDFRAEMLKAIYQ